MKNIIADFVDFTNGKYCAGVVSLVSITVKSFDIHRACTGYATSVANSKGLAIYKSRKVRQIYLLCFNENVFKPRFY